jgi:hypothetical protein
MRRGISSTYYSFIQYVRKNKRKFAFLQLAGRMEDMLVKEFAYHVWRESRGSRYPMTNVGNKGEQKFDIVVLRGTLGEKKGESESSCEVCALVEAKYLQRRHRAWEFNANDETRTSLKGLERQLGRFKSNNHYGFPVKLQARTRDVYGLVIASYVSPKPSGAVPHKDEKERFFGDILEDAGRMGFRYLDHPKPYLDKVYDDIEVRLLKGSRYCSLRVGLWKLE